ncbi:MAG: hypothetical protein AVDCRST_MAG52-2645 [uncultured Blastococcus sp.]|uniref:Mce-associated membrane protein n=1 Tax=uncultured Blastococcus sp. TaxID=217144 RepID=A0A6J4IYC2_9ACTN|nr:MAG: hypothetical protein AVDCRST_MAG52-2645 [uncultured Blastococcus sp.]
MPTSRTEEDEHLTADARSAVRDHDDEERGGSTRAGSSDAGRSDAAGRRGRRARSGLSPVPVLAGLLVLLLAGLAFSWFTRPDPSAIRTGEYPEVLQAARSAVVDFTSFDHLTFDDDVEQVRRISTREFAEQSVASLEDRRQEILDLEAVVGTEIIGAGVTTADEDDATVALLIQTTRQTNSSQQADVVRFSIQVTMERSEDRWLLAGIAGTGSE